MRWDETSEKYVSTNKLTIKRSMNTWDLINALLNNLNEDIEETSDKNKFNCLRDTIDRLESLKCYY